MALSSRTRAVLGAIALLLGVLIAFGMLDAALAQTSPFGGPRPPSPPPAPPADGILGWIDGFVGWIRGKEAQFNLATRAALRAAKADGSAVWGLLAMSFAYGIFHAAGPGHGKAVISSYVVANDETWKRGVVLSFASAMLQALVAVAIVLIATVLLNATAKTMNDATRYIEIVSYAAITLIGLRLLWAKGKGLIAAWRKPHGEAAGHDHAHHDHAHDHGHTHAMAHAHAHHDHGAHAHAHADAHTHRDHAHHDHAHHDHAHGHDHHYDHAHHHDRAHAHAHHGHDHGHNHHGHGHDHDDHASAWGHAHGPEPKDLAGPGGWRRGFSAIVAVGLRPCSGAIIVLVFAAAQGLLWAGVAATFIMGLGTAITVAAIACFAVSARGLAARFASARPGPGTLALRSLEVLAALLVTVLGLALTLGYMASSEQMIGF